MADGSRSRTGCLTCRIRKKRCDEQHPVCEACYSRQLTCYGYNAPSPSWYTDKATWEEVKNCDEAKALRRLAETRYSIQRKTGWKAGHVSKPPGAASRGTLMNNDGLLHPQTSHSPLHLAGAMDGINTTTSLLPTGAASNTWQLRPGTIWWDTRMNHLENAPGSFTGQDTRLLMLFLDVIHPITHSFYRLNSSRDRNWLLGYITGDRALYSASLSVSACFEHSLTQQPMINNIGICHKVRNLQSMAIRELRPRIDKFAAPEDLSLEDFVCAGMQLLDVVIQLLNLEVFSMLQGDWEMHHRAARLLVNNVETRSRSKFPTKPAGPRLSPIEHVMSTLPADGEQRTLAFCVTNFVWVDVIATATLGLSAYTPMAFDYHHLLHSEAIKPQYIMGCQGWVMATIGEIARLEQWKNTQDIRAPADRRPAGLIRRHGEISNRLKSGIERLEKSSGLLSSSTAPAALEEDIRLVTTIWGYAAQVFLQVATSGMGDAEAYLEQAIVSACLEKLEELPTRLVMRVHWPYTIAGCMATSGPHHERFRSILGRTLQQCQSPGVTWKGLMVMEECWRIRRMRGGDPRIGWREAMDSLGARVLLM